MWCSLYQHASQIFSESILLVFALYEVLVLAVLYTIWAQDPIKDTSFMDLPQASNFGSLETEKSIVIPLFGSIMMPLTGCVHCSGCRYSPLRGARLLIELGQVHRWENTLGFCSLNSLIMRDLGCWEQRETWMRPWYKPLESCLSLDTFEKVYPCVSFLGSYNSAEL